MGSDESIPDTETACEVPRRTVHSELRRSLVTAHQHGHIDFDLDAGAIAAAELVALTIDGLTSMGDARVLASLTKELRYLLVSLRMMPITRVSDHDDTAQLLAELKERD